MFQWLIDWFNWFIGVWNSIFEFIGNFFDSIVNMITSLFNTREWLLGFINGYGALSMVSGAIGLSIAIGIVLKILNR